MNKVKTLISFVKAFYPDWKGFEDPAFKKDEIDYKQSMIDLARELLNKETLQEFLDNGDVRSFVRNSMFHLLKRSRKTHPQTLQDQIKDQLREFVIEFFQSRFASCQEVCFWRC